MTFTERQRCVPCRKCGAKIGEGCVTSTGKQYVSKRVSGRYITHREREIDVEVARRKAAKTVYNR